MSAVAFDEAPDQKRARDDFLVAEEVAVAVSGERLARRGEGLQDIIENFGSTRGR